MASATGVGKGGGAEGQVETHNACDVSVPLAPYAKLWSADMVVLYTNSLRAELNDLVFLTGCLRRQRAADEKAVVGAACEGSGRRKGKSKGNVIHKNIQVDFEIWFHRFVHFAELLLYGFEALLFPLITELLHRRDVMVSRGTAVIEAHGVSYVEAWCRTRGMLFRKMEKVRHQMSTVQNRVILLQRSRAYSSQRARQDVWNATFESIGRVVRGMTDLLGELDVRVADILTLKVDCKGSLRDMYCDFVLLLAKEGCVQGGAPALGWSAIVTLTRWIDDRRLRAEHVAVMARCSRQGMLSRYRADQSHHAIVKLHRAVAAAADAKR